MTYLEHYGLIEAPFALTPKVGHHFVVPERGNPADVLEEAVERGEGLLKITGEPGTGKTLLCRVLGQRLQARRAVGYVPAPVGQDATALLALVCQAFGLPPSQTAAEMTTTLRIFLEDRLARGHGAVLIVDEAQTLGLAGLEAVRLLSTFETESEKLVRIVLVGQPELDVLLASADLRQLSQRITVGVRTEPFSVHQSINYIDYRIGCCRREGVDYDPFTPRAKDLLARSAEGVPRLLNTLCDKALIRAATDGALQVTEQHAAMTVEEVLDIARPSLDHAAGFGVRIPVWARVAAAVVAMVTAGGVAAALYPLWVGHGPAETAVDGDRAWLGAGVTRLGGGEPTGGAGGFMPPPAPALVMPRGETLTVTANEGRPDDPPLRGAMTPGVDHDGVSPPSESASRAAASRAAVSETRGPDEGPAALAALTARLRAGSLDSAQDADDETDGEAEIPAMPTPPPPSVGDSAATAGASASGPSLPADEAQRRVADALARLAALHEQERDAETRAARRAADEAMAAGERTDQIVAEALAEPPVPLDVDLGRPPWPVPEGQALPERPGTATEAGHASPGSSVDRPLGRTGDDRVEPVSGFATTASTAVDPGVALAPLPSLPVTRDRAEIAALIQASDGPVAETLDADTDTAGRDSADAVTDGVGDAVPEHTAPIAGTLAEVDRAPAGDVADAAIGSTAGEPAAEAMSAPDTNPETEGVTSAEDPPASGVVAELVNRELPAPDIPVIEPFVDTETVRVVDMPPVDGPAPAMSDDRPSVEVASSVDGTSAASAVGDSVGGVVAVEDPPKADPPGDGPVADAEVVRGAPTLVEPVPEEVSEEVLTDAVGEADLEIPAASGDVARGDRPDDSLAESADAAAVVVPARPETAMATPDATVALDVVSGGPPKPDPDPTRAVVAVAASQGPPLPTARPAVPDRQVVPRASSPVRAPETPAEHTSSAAPSRAGSEATARSTTVRSRPSRPSAAPAARESYTAAELNALSLESVRTGQPMRLGAPEVPPRPAMLDDPGSSAGSEDPSDGVEAADETSREAVGSPRDPEGAAPRPAPDPDPGAVDASTIEADPVSVPEVPAPTRDLSPVRPAGAGEATPRVAASPTEEREIDWSVLGRAQPGELPPPDIPTVPLQ